MCTLPMRPILGMMPFLGVQIEQVMHKVGARHCHKGEECQDETKRTEAPSAPAHPSPPSPAVCPEGLHSDTVLIANVMALSVPSFSQRAILAYRLLGSKVRVGTDRHARHCITG